MKQPDSSSFPLATAFDEMRRLSLSLDRAVERNPNDAFPGRSKDPEPYILLFYEVQHGSTVIATGCRWACVHADARPKRE